MNAQDMAFSALLGAARAGDDRAQRELMLQVYEELRRLARRNLRGYGWMQTLSATALVNEAYAKMFASNMLQAMSAEHLLNLASLVMRQIVCDYARRKIRESRLIDRGLQPPENEAAEMQLHEARHLVDIDEALKDLHRLDAVGAAVVEAKFFAGLSEAEIAQSMGVSLRTVQRSWSRAREWLVVHIKHGGENAVIAR